MVSKHKDPKTLKGYVKESLSTTLTSSHSIGESVSRCNEIIDIAESEDDDELFPVKRARTDNLSDAYEDFGKTMSSSSDLGGTSSSSGVGKSGSKGGSMPHFNFYFNYRK